MHTALLVLHIAGAVATMGASAISAFALWRHVEARYRANAFALAFLIIFQLVSGTTLYLLSENMSLFTLCKNFALYLTIPVTLEISLLIHMKKKSAESAYVQIPEAIQ